ncbi:MAG: hypothetical protein N2255_04545, partial [Kiritimatiellae bacterium]|nr:hypothetical protein [Kiritimatiellia bacterium]
FTDLPLWTVSTPDRTLRDGYGNLTDRAVLLWAMLREAGFKPRFVLSSSSASRYICLEEPLQSGIQRHLLDTPLVAVQIGRETVVLNDTDQYAALGTTPHDGKPALTLDGNWLRIAATTGTTDKIELRYEIFLKTDGEARVSVTKRYFGNEFATFHKRFAEFPPEERRRHFLELIAKLSQGAVAEGEYVTNYAVYPGIEAFTVRIPRFAVRSGPYCYVTLPDVEDQFIRLRADERKGPLYVSSPLERETTFVVQLPRTTKSIHVLPPVREWHLPGSLGVVKHSVRTVREDERVQRIEICRQVKTGNAVIKPEEYSTLLDMCRKITHPETATILVELDGE